MKTVKACLVCNNKGPFKMLIPNCSVLQGNGHKFSVIGCETCGFAFQNPQLTHKELRKYYERSTLTSGHVFSEFRKGTRAYSKTHEIRRFLSRQLPVSGKGKRIFQLLDIGAGSGTLSKELAKDGDFSVSAYDMLRLPKMNGVTTYRRKADLPPHFFDYVAAISVLEHVSDPKLFIQQCRKFLKKDGVLILEVPDSLRWTIMINNFFAAEHLWHFCLPTMISFLKRMGAVVVDLEVSRAVSNIRVAARFDQLITHNSGSDKIAECCHPSPSEILRSFLEYNATWTSYKNKIRKKLLGYRTYGRIAVFGAGQHTLSLFRLCPELKSSVSFFADNDPKKIGTKFCGKSILSSMDLLKEDIEAVLISSAHFESEIIRGLPENLKKLVPVFTIYNR
jgi:SAM-dependent methyltransferase